MRNQISFEFFSIIFIYRFSVEVSSVWSALELIGAADLCSTDREFLYEKEDYLECLNTLGESDLLDFEVGQIVL